MQLEGKVALVTGGGRGIGRGIVERFLDEGAHVVVAQREALKAPLDSHPRIVGIQTDLSAPPSTAAAVEYAVARFGALDILVNNAGIMFEHTVSDIQIEEWDLMFNINLRAPMFLIQAALPQMRKRGGGSIINIGSIEGLGANPHHAAYCASKAGIHGLTRAIAVDLGNENIRCNAIAPGWITSELSDAYLASHPDSAAASSALNRLHPIGRVGTPTDVGDLAVYLASDKAAFLTGETIVLDGGRTAKLPLPF
ncbi:SDR family NAD(P)-dependent oxidoreductase [Pseudarthrobacter albicanus]|uniref:SDR family NAD(P)-dependent oxidoreductase n=1 Tax=Pseudarthrobacter albicanus TaxID=2823873 RepID=UPI001BA884AB|nr:glucose 1-dehydrogenase [Pseudarthrobacter albicanus]